MPRKNSRTNTSEPKENVAQMAQRLMIRECDGDAQRLLDLRNRELDKLAKRVALDVEDIDAFDRIGQIQIAHRYFHKCSTPAKRLLLSGKKER